MRRRTLMLVCAAAVVAMPARLRAQAHSAPLQAWVEAFNSRDPKRIVAIYAPDAVLWGTTARTIARLRSRSG